MKFFRKTQPKKKRKQSVEMMLIYLGGALALIPSIFINKDATISIISIIAVYVISSLISSLFVPLCVLFTLAVVLRYNYTKNKRWFRNAKLYVDHICRKTKIENTHLSNTINIYLDKFIGNYCELEAEEMTEMYIDDVPFEEPPAQKMKKKKKVRVQPHDQEIHCCRHHHNYNKKERPAFLSYFLK